MHITLLRKFKKIFLILFVFFCSSCKINPTYEVTGVIIQKDTKSNDKLIDLDRIEGFMEPMIMNFNIHNNVNIKQFEPMDSVQFNLVITEKSHYAINFKVLGKRLYSKSDLENDFLNEGNLYHPK